MAWSARHEEERKLSFPTVQKNKFPSITNQTKRKRHYDPKKRENKLNAVASSVAGCSIKV
jgi:hypothetical protein